MIGPSVSSCPCGCVIVGTRLARYGHVKGCACRRCTGWANQRKGRQAAQRMHRSLGGSGRADLNEGRTVYTVVVSPEVKTGEQIPASWTRFVSSVFFTGALAQNIRNLPIGSVASPAICLEGRYVIVDLKGERARARR